MNASIIMFAREIYWYMRDFLQLLPYLFKLKHGFSHGFVSLTFDDGWASQLTALKHLQRWSYKGSFYLSPGLLGQPEYLSIQDVLALAHAGMHIGSHGMTHAPLNLLSPFLLNNELIDAQYYLANHIGKKVIHFASPWGISSPAIVQTIRRFYSSHRGVKEGFNRPGFDLFNIKIKCVNQRTKLKHIQRWLRIAERTNSWLVLSFHEVSNTPCGGYSISPQDFDKLLQLVHESKLKVLTLAEALQKLAGQPEEEPLRIVSGHAQPAYNLNSRITPRLN